MPERIVTENNPIEQRNQDEKFKKEADRADKEGGEPEVDKVYEKGILEEETGRDEFTDQGIEDDLREQEEDNVDRLEDSR